MNRIWGIPLPGFMRWRLARLQEKLRPERGFLKHYRIRRGRLCVEYFSVTNNGFFSNCSTVLADILRSRRRFMWVDKINLSKSMYLYKNDPSIDIYDSYFSVPNSPPKLRYMHFDAWDIHEEFRKFDLAAFHELATHFFSPSLAVQNYVKKMATAINLDPENTIAVYYRGTDKHSEITIPAFQEYDVAVETIDQKYSKNLSILIQTDQQEAREYFLSRYRDRVIYFSDLPVSTGDKGIHLQDYQNTFKISPEQLAMGMLSSVLQMARCKHVVTSSGNVGFWIAIYRGNANELYQYNAKGQLVMPG